MFKYKVHFKIWKIYTKVLIHGYTERRMFLGWEERWPGRGEKEKRFLFLTQDFYVTILFQFL